MCVLLAVGAVEMIDNDDELSLSLSANSPMKSLDYSKLSVLVILTLLS